MNISRKIVWSNLAKQSLKEYYDYIRKDSLAAAIKVKKEIISATKQLEGNPEKFQLDEFYPNNPGNIRRFYKWSYRIIYEVNKDSIDILNIVHTSREPSNK